MAPFVIADDPADPLLDEVATENGFPVPRIRVLNLNFHFPVSHGEMPLKSNVIQAANVSETTLTEILDNGAIEYADNGGLYVTGYPFNFWMENDESRKLLVMYTYWHTLPEVDELEMLRFVNQTSGSKIMLQFYYNAEYGRYYAYYTHPYHVGLLPPHVLKLGQKFTAIFEEVVHDGIAKGLLRELPECPYDADDSEEAAADGTVH